MDFSPPPLPRRRFIAGGLALAAATIAARLPAAVTEPRGVLPAGDGPALPVEGGRFALPPLPWAAEALEPEVDAETMTIHHARHHAAYVRGLNAALERGGIVSRDLPALLADPGSWPAEVAEDLRNHGGGHWNHALFWEGLGPAGSPGTGEPVGELAARIEDDFGSFAGLHGELRRAALTVFGSGWAWVVLGAEGRLRVTHTPNQDNPLMRGLVERPGLPLLGIDVWEHAYYLKHQNKRGDYLTAVFRCLRWDVVAARLAAAEHPR